VENGVTRAIHQFHSICSALSTCQWKKLLFMQGGFRKLEV